MKGELRGQDWKGRWDWLNFAAGLPAKPFQLKAVTASQTMTSGRYIFVGGVFNNTATTAATVTVYDGQDATGEIIGQVTVPASSSLSLNTANDGVLAEIGLFVAVSGGTVTGSVWAVPLWHYNITPPGE